MQKLTPHFQQYIARIYDGAPATATEPLSDDAAASDSTGDGGAATTGGLRIVIDWGALDIDRPAQTIRRANDTEAIVELLRVLLEEFKKPMREQLTELPIVRFPLSTNPKIDFLNRAQNRPFSYTQIPGTDLFFCPHSDRAQKVERLRALFSKLTLPDGSEFPEECITVSVEEGT